MSRDFSLDEIGKRLRGEGLTPEEQILADDDTVRVQWIRDQFKAKRTAIDIGASDGSIAALLAEDGHTVYAIERHPAHAGALAGRRGLWIFLGEAEDGLKSLSVDAEWAYSVCGEIIEHLHVHEAERLLMALPTDWLILTVPNANCASYKASGRSRHEWPDHKQYFSAMSLERLLRHCGWSNYYPIAPIVGTLDDSIWLGAVCRRS